MKDLINLNVTVNGQSTEDKYFMVGRGTTVRVDREGKIYHIDKINIQKR